LPCFRVIAHHTGQIFTFNRIYTLVQGEPLNPGPRNLASRNMKHRSVVWYWYICRRLFCFITMHAFDRQTDRQRDRQISTATAHI